MSQLKKLQFTARKLFKPKTVSYAGLLTLWTGAPSLPQDICKALYKECHQHLEHQLATATLSRGNRVLEIGAGIGLISLVCARICGPDAVLSYEANPKMADIIRRNFELNGMIANLRNKAVATQSGEISFYFNDNVVSSSIIDRGFGGATTVACDGFA
ncbi:FkbM family methyltransferase [Breoghania sp.]|uniref:FkbM family methyltransferase n=1 Tax=Breoghania sp. TaxID=2065378 RepID=UPI002624A706|nr:FkbM family methyltransferase [Breoghania sp.]